MTLTAEADILAAITARLRTFTEITNLTSTRIGGEIGEAWFSGPAATYAVRLRRTGGPVDLDQRTAGIARARLDCWCYGSSAKTANDLLSLVLAALCPVQGAASGNGSFIQTLTGGSKVRVYAIAPEVEPISDREPDTGYRFAWCPLVATWGVLAA